MKGIYALVIGLEKETAINVGALGRTAFQKGLYIYVGSAQTNIEQRVKRHLKKEKRLFWHIDYLLNSNVAKVEKVFYNKGGKAAECSFAIQIGKQGEPVIGFGCSDCNCVSHLYRLSECTFLEKNMRELKMEP